jgi:hypothetical protein
MPHYDLRSALLDTGLGQMTNADEYIDQIILVVQNMLFSVDVKKFENFKLINIVSNENGYTFSWESKSTRSPCPRCGAVSTTERHTYKNRVIIDEPIMGLPVMHTLREKVFICFPCKEKGDPESFVEDISSICRRPRIRTTTKIDEKIVNDGIYRSANGLADGYTGSINISAGTILNRVKEAGGMVTEKNLTDTGEVKVLSIDDNNARKGASSTASTVVVDIERHIILVVAKGADSEAAKNIFERFPNAEKLSRDRACAYSKAGSDCGLEQIADLFHLVLNAHTAVKDALSGGLSYNIYTKQGESWVELPTSGMLPELRGGIESTPVITLTDEDIALRVHYASLSARQEKKYRTVINILCLQDQGLSSKEINNRLGINGTDRVRLMSEAADVINDVEEKIDEYFANSGERKTRQKTIGKRAKPSSESIVEPYGDTVMRLADEGVDHRKIHPVIKEMGFTGSPNAIYQYVLKKRNENSPDIDGNASNMASAPGRPPRISMQRVTKTAVYKFVLHEAAVNRGTKTNEASTNEITNSDEALEKEKPQEITSAFYSDTVAKIIFGTKKEEINVKKK